jgi:hypothetical protein
MLRVESLVAGVCRERTRFATSQVAAPPLLIPSDSEALRSRVGPSKHGSRFPFGAKTA